MMSLILLLSVLVLLFVMSFATKRRFGVLGLALAAGALLSANWSGTLTPFIQSQGIAFISPPLQVVVEVALILLPAIALLFNGPTYSKMWQRVLGSIGFALLGYTLLAGTLNTILQVDEPGLSFYAFMKGYANVIIVVGVIAAVTDAFFTSSPRRKKREH